MQFQEVDNSTTCTRRSHQTGRVRHDHAKYPNADSLFDKTKPPSLEIPSKLHIDESENVWRRRHKIKTGKEESRIQNRSQHKKLRTESTFT